MRPCVLAAARSCRLFSSSRTIKELDVVFLRQSGPRHSKWHLSSRLRPGGRVKLSHGASVGAQDLIGRKILDTVQDSGGHKVVIYEPTFANYILNSSTRLATPIYPHDASTIVSLLELHPDRPGEEAAEDDAPPFEIFEAGTGMGSLTLHMARAVHAANPPVPASLRLALCEAKLEYGQDARILVSPEDQAALDAYAASRRAIVHSLDCKPQHLSAAYKLVRNYRRAQYLAAVDFHVGSVDDYLSERLARSGGRPFLSRAVLDLPSAHKHAERLVQALHPNGILVVFKPSISQIAEFEAWSMQTQQPLRLEKVLELPLTTTTPGGHDAGGGRLWNVKWTVPKAGSEDEDKAVQILRPKVGDRVAGGGFAAVLRRWPLEDTTLVPAEVGEVGPEGEAKVVSETNETEAEGEATLVPEANETEPDEEVTLTSEVCEEDVNGEVETNKAELEEEEATLAPEASDTETEEEATLTPEAKETEAEERAEERRL